MHLLTKIRLFRACLWLTRPLAWVFVYPLALLRPKHNSRYFFFFDRYSLGGAQRVHLDILNALAEQQKSVFFTRQSWDEVMKGEFYASPNTRTRDVHNFCENILLRLFTVHFYAFFLNRHRGAKVLSSNSTFFYDMLPFIREDTEKIELLHCFTYGNNGLEFLGLGSYQFLDRRFLVDFATAKNIEEQYAAYHIPVAYLKRLVVIEPGVYVPDTIVKEALPPLRILYAGRGGPQKRIWLLDRIAKQCYEAQLPVEFHFAGTLFSELSDFVKERSVLHGKISEVAAMQALYHQCNATIMTSWFEGFPMFVKESMAWGCVPVVTALDGNRTHLHNGENALLLHNPEDEAGVVDQGVTAIQKLARSPELLRRLSANAHQYAKDNFSIARFTARYEELLTS